MDIEYDGKRYNHMTSRELLAAGVPITVIAESAKAEKTADLVAHINMLRSKVASPNAGKLMLDQLKANIAANRDTTDPEHMALIAREATARGMTTDALLDLIAQKDAAYAQITLQIGALEAEGKAAINAVPDDAADIETAVSTALSTFLTNAKAEFDQAFAEINGG